MKKNDWILLTSAFFYSFLFYQQSAGINFLIFTCLLIVGLIIKNNQLFSSHTWKIAAFGSFLSASCIAYYGSTLALTANIISLSILSGLSISSRSSVIFSLLFSAYSYVTSLLFMYFDWIERKQKGHSNDQHSYTKKIILWIVPLLVFFLFFQFYRASNPLFEQFAGRISFNFISLSWITFTIGGFILLYGFYYHKQVIELANFDEKGNINLSPLAHEPMVVFGKQIDLQDENFSGKLMFLLLNLLLFIVNLLDFNFIFIDRELPKDMTYSAFVHQGTGMVIASIVLAISIILFYFRGALNFYKQSNTIKVLAYLWIAQNVLMLISTAFRNELYIEAYGLTYKRIGVYVYLLLCVIGLLTTFVKIVKLKSNHFLFRTNGWLFYGVLIIACVFNWDVMITSFNIKVPQQIEKGYMVKLSDKVLPMLLELESNDNLHRKEFVNESYVAHTDNYRFDETLPPTSYEQELSRKLFKFMQKSKNQNWQSWYFEQYNTCNDLIKLNKKSLIKQLDLSAYRVNSLYPLRELDNIKSLKLRMDNVSMSELSYFPNLTYLDLHANNLKSLHGLHALQQLEYLDISVNPIVNYNPIFELKQLKKIVLNIGTDKAIIEKLNTQFPGIIISFS